MYQDYLTGMTIVSVLLLVMLYGMKCCTVRIYNWNGERFCYLGRARLHKNGGGYLVHMRERMADLSYTTLYQICPSKRFVRRNRYKDMVLSAGESRCLLHVDGCMRESVYYRHAPFSGLGD